MKLKHLSLNDIATMTGYSYSAISKQLAKSNKQTNEYIINAVCEVLNIPNTKGELNEYIKRVQ